MDRPLISTAIQYEHDVVLARQRARQIAALLGFDTHDQVRIATAVSEIVRNVFRYAKKGNAQFAVSRSAPPVLRVRVQDEGPGIENLQDVLDGRYISRTGMGMGILGARRLMDEFDIQSTPGQGTTVLLGKSLPKRTPAIADRDIKKITDSLFQQPSQDPFEELQRQNQELLATMAELQRQKTELSQLNKELEDTNRGVVALYAELDERADYLRRASELKTQFLSNMTHEFRTPLNSIVSLTRILLEGMDGPLNEEQEKQVRFIQQAAGDLYELVNDLLDLAKVEAGKVTIQPAEFRVQDLFGALRGMLRPLLAHNSAVSLVLEDPKDLTVLNTDQTKVSQVLRNLISNALKYTQKGEVKVTAREESPRTVTFFVTDTGIGISRADQERIFEEFTQVEGEHQKGKPGTGLGLPLSRKLAALLGGSLTVQSEPGRGSCFALRIPMNFAGHSDIPPMPELPGSLDPEKIPILIVEDNAETLLTYEKYLQGTRYQMIAVRTLAHARAALDKLHPAAIVLDILLGREHAWAFLSELKQSPGTREIPVLVVTQVENERKALSLGADAFHSKPVDKKWFLTQLSELLAIVPHCTALAIDDDPAARYILRGLLSQSGCQMLEAPDALTGLKLAREQKPGVVFLDLKMPDTDGFQTLELLRKEPETASIPVVIYTSKVMTAAEKRSVAGKALAIIQKNHADREASAELVRHALLQAQHQHSTRPASNAQP